MKNFIIFFEQLSPYTRPFKNEVATKMAFLDPLPFVTILTLFSLTPSPKNGETFLPKGNYKINFGTCLVLHMINLIITKYRDKDS